jgi:hypothetical protein
VTAGDTVGAAIRDVTAHMARLPTDQTSTFVNSGAAGVNRLVSVDDLLLIDNIGRNFEIRRIVSPGGAPVFEQRALYDVTAFPGEDNASILDSDVHAAFVTSDGSTLLTCNHFGRVRCFDWPLQSGTAGRRLTSRVDLQLPGDTERLAFHAGCLITSSPRGAYAPEPPCAGIFISEPVTPHLLPGLADGVRRLDCRHELESWGIVMGLAIDRGLELIAVASTDRLGLFRLTTTRSGVRLGDSVWERPMRYATQFLAFDSIRGRLLSAGYEDDGRDPDGDDWNACRGGMLARFTMDGDVLSTAALPDATAWGYGSDAIAVSPGSDVAYALDRSAGLHSIDLATGSTRDVCAGLCGPNGEPVASLGIGHCLVAAGRVYAGFSRGGYRLFRYDIAPRRG